MEGTLRGKCMGMCPLQEIRQREKERLLHPLEIIPGTEKAPKACKERVVKAFSRSAAGKHMKIEFLRPTDVLLETVRYLLTNVIISKKLPWHLTYDFITDRLLAVRQDMVIQDLSPAETITILQPIVRFHAYAAYKSCQDNITNFDPALNNGHLQECLKKLLHCYDYYNYLTSLDYILENRPEFEALYLIFNLGNEEALRRYLTIPDQCKTQIVEKSFQCSVCFLHGNFVRLSRMLKKLPFLLAAVASLHLPAIRKRSLQVMSIGFSSKNLYYPLNHLKNILLYEDEKKLIKDCQHYGIRITEQGICFLKGSFQSGNNLPTRHEQFVDEMLVEENIEYILLGM